MVCVCGEKKVAKKESKAKVIPEAKKVLSKITEAEKILNEIADSLFSLYASKKISLSELLYVLEVFTNLKGAIDRFHSAVEDVAVEIGE
jgi:biotin synthase-related radical SAM superfamily protein